MEDTQIIDLYLARNENAISETSKKYGHMLKSIAYNILKNNADSEECENDTYNVAWNKIPPHIPQYLAAFLGRIIRNISLDKYDYYTAAKRNHAFEITLSEMGDILPDHQTPELEYEAKETAGYINTFLSTKSYIKRTIFVRRYWYCDTISKIAEDYGFSESKVKSMLMRMRNELKTVLERREVTL